MKFYLSSYKLGNEVEKLKKMMPKNRKVAYIPNALDYSKDAERRRKSEGEDINQLGSVGFEVEILDLRKYFGKSKELEKRLGEFGSIWVRGGNTFVLMQAIKLSGFDTIFKKLLKKEDFLYGGYSAGVCILAPDLHGIDLMDDKTQKPYGDYETVWECLGVLDYYIVPHYKTPGHPETETAEKAVQYFIDNRLLFKALRDGEVIVMER